MSKERKEKFKKGEQEKFESFLKNHFHHILHCGNLNHYKIRDIQVHDFKHAMAVDVEPRYLEIRVDYSEDYAVRHLRDEAWEELLTTFCHEISHIVHVETEDALNIENSFKTRENVFERLTEHVSRWLYANYVQYMKDYGIDIKTGTTA